MRGQDFFWLYPSDRYYYTWYGEDPVEHPTDGEIKSRLVDRLRTNVHTRDDYIHIDVKRGVVILTGDVSSPVAKRVAGDDAWDTLGVRDVSNQLHVQERSNSQASDSNESVV